MNYFTILKCQATFCGSTQHDRAGHQFTTRDLESIGYHFLDSLLDYCDPDHTKVCLNKSYISINYINT